VLVECLDDPDRTVRLAAAESLSITTDAAVVRDVVRYAVDDDVGVRAAGAVGLTRALAAVPYELARAEVETLLDAFASADPSAEDGRLARESLLAAVAEGSTPGGLAFLGDEHTALVVDALRTGAPAVREQAVRVLGYVGREDVREPLEGAREDDVGAVGDAAEAALRRDG
jgi:HEAT repeat.